MTYAKFDSVEERFWSKVDKSGDCWLWTAHLDEHGYGQFMLRTRRIVRAHRFAYELATGVPVPRGAVVRHVECDNPACVNPAHLALGTQKDNSADMMAKGRQNFQRSPELRARGDRHGLRKDPSRAARGERHGSRTKPESLRRGSDHGNSSLTEEDVKEMRRLYDAKQASQADLARRFGVVKSTVRFVVLRKTWRHVA